MADKCCLNFLLKNPPHSLLSERPRQPLVLRDNPAPCVPPHPHPAANLPLEAEAPGTRAGQGPEDGLQNLSPFSRSIKTEYETAASHPNFQVRPPGKDPAHHLSLHLDSTSQARQNII